MLVQCNIIPSLTDPKPEAEPEPARSSLLSRIRKANRFVLGPSDELMYWFSMTNVIVSLASGWLILYQVCTTVNNPCKAELFVFKPWRPKGYFLFEIIINVLVISFWFIWIPMLWVYDHYKYFNSFNAGTVFIRQILMHKDGPRTERVNPGGSSELFNFILQSFEVVSLLWYTTSNDWKGMWFVKCKFQYMNVNPTLFFCRAVWQTVIQDWTNSESSQRVKLCLLGPLISAYISQTNLFISSF